MWAKPRGWGGRVRGMKWIRIAARKWLLRSGEIVSFLCLSVSLEFINMKIATVPVNKTLLQAAVGSLLTPSLVCTGGCSSWSHHLWYHESPETLKGYTENLRTALNPSNFLENPPRCWVASSHGYRTTWSAFLQLHVSGGLTSAVNPALNDSDNTGKGYYIHKADGLFLSGRFIMSC